MLPHNTEETLKQIKDDALTTWNLVSIMSKTPVRACRKCVEVFISGSEHNGDLTFVIRAFVKKDRRRKKMVYGRGSSASVVDVFGAELKEYLNE